MILYHEIVIQIPQNEVYGLTVYEETKGEKKKDKNWEVFALQLVYVLVKEVIYVKVI